MRFIIFACLTIKKRYNIFGLFDFDDSKFVKHQPIEVFMQHIKHFFLKDKVFLIAFVFAALSIIIHPVFSDYKTYINYKVLIVMFSLMLSVAGMTDQHLFTFIAVKMVKHLRDMRLIALVIIITTFFLGMLITNDAVLLTLVPFTLFVTSKINRHKEALIIVILQTLAANLGSALTPMGDPQNIFLYTNFNIPFWVFMSKTAVITITGFILLILTVFIVFKDDVVKPIVEDVHIKDYRIWIYFVMFMLAILTVLHVVNPYIALGIVVLLGLLCSRAEFRKVDYHLLLTFVMFFIFTGNISNLEVVQNLFERILNSSTNVFFTGLLVSQVISNVPATVLLSAFTEEAYLLDLLQGVNVGAMGTIIGSLASLITLKFVIKLYPERFKEYLIKYTVICLIYMAVIISVIFIL